MSDFSDDAGMTRRQTGFVQWEKCTAVRQCWELNFIKIWWHFTEIWQYNDYQDGDFPPLEFLKFENFHTRPSLLSEDFRFASAYKIQW